LGDEVAHFTVVARGGEFYDTNHISPVYSETDHAQQIAFVCRGVMHVLPAVEVLNIKLNPVPYPRSTCPHCKH
jgi:hypothetical protein